MIEPQDAAIRHLLRTNPAYFFDFAVRLLHSPADVVPWSARVLGSSLARCLQGGRRRLIVNMPPRTLKSSYASVALPAYALAVRPELKIICIAGHRGLANDHHAKTLALMTHPSYRALFPHVKTTSTASKICLPHGGSRSASTPTGPLTGRGADLVIIDDPQKTDESEDPRKSDSIRRWYDRNIYQRLDSKPESTVVLVMQRLAQDDLTAHLLANGNWELLCLPAVAMRDERFDGVFGNRIVRRRGEALNPARDSLIELRAALMEVGAREFMAQYQQDPYPPGQNSRRGGAFHIAPHPDADVSECKGAEFFFGRVEEEVFVLDRVFGERTRLRMGPPPTYTVDEWEQRFRQPQQ